MSKYKNMSIDSIEKDKLNDLSKSSESNVIEIDNKDDTVLIPSESFEGGTNDKNPYSASECLISVNVIDFELSNKYPLTLKEARRRAVRSIRKRQA